MTYASRDNKQGKASWAALDRWTEGAQEEAYEEAHEEAPEKAPGVYYKGRRDAC